MGVLLSLFSKRVESGRTHPDGVVANKYSYWNGRTVGSALQFFIERWDREKNKPRFYVVHPIEPTGIVEIRVKVNNHIQKKRARFYIVSIGNEGINTAEKVTAIISVSKIWTRTQTVLMSAPAERPDLTISWPRTQEEFNDGRNPFALAVILDALAKQKECGDLSLSGGGPGFSFTLFFTIEGDDLICFPTAAAKAIAIQGGREFDIELFLHAKDLRLTPAKTFRVKARAWNDFSVEEGPSVVPLNPPSLDAQKSS